MRFWRGESENRKTQSAINAKKKHDARNCDARKSWTIGGEIGSERVPTRYAAFFTPPSRHSSAFGFRGSLRVAFEPGALVTPAFAEGFAATLKGCRVNLGPGLHYLQKDHPSAIGHAISGWIAGIETARRGELHAA